MFLKRTLVAGAFVVATAVAANAADIPMVPAPPPPPAPPPAPVFNWGGPYVGAYAGVIEYFGFGPDVSINGGLQAGYDFVAGALVVGVEGEVGFRWALGFGDVYLDTAANVRLGAIVTPKLLLYARAGVGYLWTPDILYWDAVGGMEYAVGTNASIFLEAGAVGVIGGPGPFLQIEGGINWRP